jgi:type II secretory pathway pseudopilin PulG
MRKMRKIHFRTEWGFSLIELAVVMAVTLIVTAVSVPSFLRTVRTYQVNDAATRVASVLKFTRYEAIRLNATTTISSLVQPGGTGNCPAAAIRCVWTDSNRDGNLQRTENQVQFTGSVTLVPAATPPGGLAAAAGVAGLTNVPLAAGFVAFDQRGAVNPAAVDVLYVGDLSRPDLGYRAVVVLPSGSVQIWTTDTTGNWRQTN